MGHVSSLPRSPRSLTGPCSLPHNTYRNPISRQRLITFDSMRMHHFENGKRSCVKNGRFRRGGKERTK